MQRQRRLLVPAVLAGLGLASAAIAQPQPFSDEPAQYRSNKPYESEVRRAERQRAYEAGDPSDSPLSVTGGVDFRDQYFYRGYNSVSSGFIAQPYVDVGYTVYEGHGFSVTPHGGAWLDLTENKAPDPPEHFREFRGIGGVAVEFGKFVVDVNYVYYSSPGNAFGESQEIGFDLRYDDRDAWRRCPFVAAVNPSFSLYRQIEDENDDDLNTFLGVGLEPTLKPVPLGPIPVTVSFPMTLGGSYDGYYRDSEGHNAPFGYFEGGVKAGLPLGNSVYGMRWSVEAEVDYVRLLAFSANRANGGDGSDIVFRVGFAFR